jgi:integrase/recombinase XerD
MSQRSIQRKIKKSIKKEDFLRLREVFELKELELLNSGKKNVKFQLLRLENINIAFTLLYYTGMRMSELQNIKVSDIVEAIQTQELYIYQSKTNEVRCATISTNGVAEFKKVIDEYLNEVDRDTYILRRWGNPKQKLSVGYLERILNSFLRTALGQRYSTHGFRRGLINDMIERGYSTFQVQKMIGHKNISTTSIYADALADAHKQEIINSVR